MTTNEMATADIREAWIKETRLVLKSDELIKSKRDLYSRVKDNAERKNIPLIVESTFYKYLKAMKLRAMPNGVFAYEDDHTTFFDTLITHMDFVDKVYLILCLDLSRLFLIRGKESNVCSKKLLHITDE